MFNFSNNSIENSATITDSIFNSYYPDGQQVVKNTSLYSKDFGNQLTRERTLTSRSLSEAFSGDAIYRSSKFSTTFYNKALSSSLNSLLTGGSEAAFTTKNVYKIQDPEGSSKTSQLTGGAAFSRVIVDSIAGRNAASEFVGRASASIAKDYSTVKSYPAISSSADPGSTAGPGSAASEYPDNGRSPGAGGRIIMLESEMSTDEKTYLLERAKKLFDTGIVRDSSGLKAGFDFDIPNGLTGLRMTSTHYPGISDVGSVSSALVESGKQRAYMCPALIELLLYLSSKITIKGGAGFGRGLSGQGSNRGDLKPNDYVSDHVFGRGFDISLIGQLSGTAINVEIEGPDVAKYRKALEILLPVLATAPLYLIPDMIVVHPGLSAEYGLVEGGYEPETSKIKQLYPGIKYVGFGADPNHKGHIHMSFAAARGGIYSGPGGQMGAITLSAVDGLGGAGARGSRPGSRILASDAPTNVTDPQSTVPVSDPTSTGTDSTATDFLSYIREVRSNNPFNPVNKPAESANPGVTVPGDPLVVPSDVSDPKFIKDYTNDSVSKLTREDVYALLRLTVMSDEAAAIFVSIAAREGGSRPRATNVTGTSKGGDWSAGMFQCNFLPGAHGTKTFSLPLPSPIEMKGWQIAYKDWQKDGVNASNFIDICLPKAKTIPKGDRWAFFDSRMWIPLNQAYIAYTVISGQTFTGNKLGLSPESGYIFYPWGDYGGGPPFGFISNLKFSTARDMYVSSGKTEQQLKDWVVKMFQTSGKNSKSAPYAEKWIQGWEFRASYRGGWVDPIEVPPGG